jgi:hypothetical protein
LERFQAKWKPVRVNGAQGAFFAELFPVRIRYSGLSLV